MANELLKKADAEAMFDSIAKAYQLVLAAVGMSDDANTLGKSASNCLADVLTHTTDDSNLWIPADLADAAQRYVDNTVMGAYFLQPAADFMRAIEKHASKRESTYSDINDYLNGEGIRVHPYLRVLYSNIDPANTWALTLETTTGTLDVGNEVVALGAYAVTGAGVGTYTAGTAIDTNTYGDSLIKAVVTSAGGIGAGSDIVATIVGLDQDGSSVSTTVTITAGSAQNVEFDVASIRFASISACTNTNGTAADTWDFIARDDRVPTL